MSSCSNLSLVSIMELTWRSMSVSAFFASSLIRELVADAVVTGGGAAATTEVSLAAATGLVLFAAAVEALFRLFASDKSTMSSGLRLRRAADL